MLPSHLVVLIGEANQIGEANFCSLCGEARTQALSVNVSFLLPWKAPIAYSHQPSRTDAYVVIYMNNSMYICFVPRLFLYPALRSFNKYYLHLLCTSHLSAFLIRAQGQGVFFFLSDLRHQYFTLRGTVKPQGLLPPSRQRSLFFFQCPPPFLHRSRAAIRHDRSRAHQCRPLCLSSWDVHVDYVQSVQSVRLCAAEDINRLAAILQILL